MILPRPRLLMLILIGSALLSAVGPSAAEELVPTPTDSEAEASSVAPAHVRETLQEALPRRAERVVRRAAADPRVLAIESLLRGGQPSRARSEAEKLLAEEPDLLSTRYFLAVSLVRLGEPNDALEHLAEVLSALPDSGSAWLWTGRCLEDLGAKLDAIACYQAAIEAAQPDTGAVQELARARNQRPRATQPDSGALAKHEPERGCYVGAYMPLHGESMRPITGFEEQTGKEHAIYLTYVSWERPFPKDWVDRVTALGAVPHIAWEPSHGLDNVRDNEYLRSWARAAGEYGKPVFLRFASEMNGNWDVWDGQPTALRTKFRLVHDIMEELAPNVAMVWTVFQQPIRNISAYYPGDEYVDWVGVNIYSVYCHDGQSWRPASHEDPVAFLRPVYNAYASRKPIQISEYAATHRCYGTGRDTGDWAVQKMTRLYDAIRTEFPRVKAIHWFCCDPGAAGSAHNDYSVMTHPAVLEAYRGLMGDGYWLSSVVEPLSAPEPPAAPKPFLEISAPVRSETAPRRTASVAVTSYTRNVGSVSARVVEVDLSVAQLRVGLGQGRIGRTESLAGIADRYGALAAINGSFFDAYSNSQLRYPDFALITGGHQVWRSTLGTMLGYRPGVTPRISRVFPSPALWIREGEEAEMIHASSSNRNTASGSRAVFTPEHSSPQTPEGGIQAVVRDGVVESVGRGSQRIPADGFVVASFGESGLPEGLVKGAACRLGLAVGDGTENAEFWASIQEGLACGPTLVNEGRVAIDPASEGFRDPKVTTQSASRSAVGVTQENHVLFVTCGGATMPQLAGVMLGLGCVEAMNLDGGGSSGLWFQGRYLTQPGRELSNALLVVPAAEPRAGSSPAGANEGG